MYKIQVGKTVGKICKKPKNWAKVLEKWKSFVTK